MEDYKGKIYYRCNTCGALKFTINTIKAHVIECKNKPNDLIEGEDYVVCAICGYHRKKLGNHITIEHKIDLDEYKAKYNKKIICEKSSDTYKKQNAINSDWINRAKERGEDLSEYKKKMGDAVREAILSDPKERQRRAEVMAKVNKTEEMRNKSSETAKKTSARPDIQQQRSAQLKRWRDNNSEEFYNKCIYKMLKSSHSKPEIELFNVVKTFEGCNFTLSPMIISDTFISTSKRKQIDIGDSNKGIYLEFDGPRHFKNIDNQLKTIKKKDDLLDAYIVDNNLTLIRVSQDQFSYTKRNYGFSKECLQKLFFVLENNLKGVFYIGELYGSKTSDISKFTLEI